MCNPFEINCQSENKNFSLRMEPNVSPVEKNSVIGININTKSDGRRLTNFVCDKNQHNQHSFNEMEHVERRLKGKVLHLTPVFTSLKKNKGRYRVFNNYLKAFGTTGRVNIMFSNFCYPKIEWNNQATLSDVKSKETNFSEGRN